MEALKMLPQVVDISSFRCSPCTARPWKSEL